MLRLFARSGKPSSKDAALAGISKAGPLLKHRQTDVCGASGNSSGGGSSGCRGDKEWESQFFVLNDHSLTYYPVGQRKGGLTAPCGDVLLTGDTKVIEASSSVLRLDTGFEVMFIRARDSTDAKDWKRSIEANVDRIGELPRGYFTKVRATSKWRRRRGKRLFFMLHHACITQHASYAQTSVISSILPLLETTTVSTFGVTGIVVTTGPSHRAMKWSLIADTKREQGQWITAISQAITTTQVMSSLPVIPVNFPDATLDGFLSMRQAGGVWNEHFFVATKDSLHRVEKDYFTNKTSSKAFPLTPNTIVSSTSLHNNSFEVVTFSDVLHLNASSREAKNEWMAAIRGLVASTGKYSKEDKLQAASLARDCEYYSVLFKSNNSPGLVLERRADIALVSKVTRSLQHCVFAGSVLIAINSEPVVSQSYEYIVNLLSDWKPPLTLRFCSPPKKSGWLHLRVHPNPYTNFSSPQNRTKLLNSEPWWEEVYVELKAGKFIIQRCGSGDTNSSSNGTVISLRGSAIALVDPRDVRHTRNCFRLMNGLETTILQASSHNEMMNWATSVVHGISIESGGGFLLDHGKIHDEKLSLASRPETTSEEFSSSPHASSPYPTQATRPARVLPKQQLRRQSKQVAESKYPSTPTLPSPRITADSGISIETKSSGYQSSNSYKSRPSDEGEALENRSLLNHRCFLPSDAMGGSNDGSFEPFNNIDDRRPSIDLAYSSDDNDDSVFGDDPFDVRKLFPISKSPEDGYGAAADITRRTPDTTRSFASTIDSDGFPVISGEFAVQEASPAAKQFVRNMSASARGGTKAPEESSSCSQDSGWMDVAPLSVQELDDIYDSCSSDGDHVNPLSFSKLLRYVEQGSTSRGNPYHEMSLFSSFSSDGSGGRGVLSKEEFIRGVRRMEEEDGIESSLYQKLIRHVR